MLISFFLFASFAMPNLSLFAQKQDRNQPQTKLEAREIMEKKPEDKAVISGMVFYPASKKPVDDALIFFNREDLGDESSTRRTISGGSKADGSYRTEVPAGDYSICAWKQSENYLLPDVLPFGLPTGGKCEKVSVSAGETRQINLTLAPKSNSLEGKVVDWNSIFLPHDSLVVLYRPLKFAKGKWVLTSMEEATWDAKVEVAPDENGNFIINGLPEGTYFLRIELPGKQTWLYKKKNSANELIPIQIKNNTENKISFSYY